MHSCLREDGSEPTRVVEKLGPDLGSRISALEFAPAEGGDGQSVGRVWRVYETSR
jgi:hypothetical protein